MLGGAFSIFFLCLGVLCSPNAFSVVNDSSRNEIVDKLLPDEQFFFKNIKNKIQKFDGHTFNYAGPNCFGTALFMTDVFSFIRGVDTREFLWVLKNHCSEISKPNLGDIGVFSPPGNFFPIHAFVFLNAEHVFEKQGIDLADASPMQVQEWSQTKYRVEASPECRRWATEKKECYNQVSFYRCRGFKKPLKLIDFEKKLHLFLLESDKISFEELKKDFFELKRAKLLMEEQLESIEKQMKFLKMSNEI